MSIEGIALGHFSELTKDDINSTTPSSQSNELFQYVLSGYSRQDDSTTNAHRKHLI